MRLEVTAQATADLDDIHAYISEANPAAADGVIARILQSLAILESFPLIGRVGRVEETREWSISGLPYVAIYRIVNETDLSLLRVMHTSRRWPASGG